MVRRRRLVRFDLVRFDVVRFDVVGQHLVGFDVVRFDVVGQHLVGFDVVRKHLVGFDLVMSVPTRRPPRGPHPLVAVARLAGPTTRVLVFASVLAGIGLLLLMITPMATVEPQRSWTLPFFALVIAFAVAEGTALHVEIRKESHSLSLSAIPLMFGLLYVSPAMLVLAYIGGATSALLWIRKTDLIKAIWNSCLFVAETAAAGLIVQSFLGGRMPETFHEWLVPFGAVLVAELMSLVAVPLVIMAVDTKFRPGLFNAVSRSQMLAALAGAFTVTAAAASTGDPLMLVFAFVPVVGLGVLLRSAGSLSQRFEDLQQLHSFTKALSNERGARTLDTGLVHLAEVMRTRTAGLLSVESDGDRTTTIRMLRDETFVDVDSTTIAPLLLLVLEQGAVTQLDEDDDRSEVRELLQLLDAQRILATPVLGEADEDGVLFVTDRLGMRREFTVDELRLFASMSRTLSARLSNDHLVEQLEAQAQHDALTGLPNRLSFEIALTSMLSDAQRSGVVVMVDLDGFKDVNDSLGHETGDQLLIEVGDRLRGAIRSDDMVARFGGDEFALLLTDRNAAPEELVARIERIHVALTTKVELSGINFQIGASLGVVKWPLQGGDSAGVLRRADTAMYQAKRNQLGVVWYTPELDADAPRRIDLYLSARAALESEELSIQLQPKVSNADGRIVGAEALVRWTHPAHGPISPTEFVPLLTHAGLIGKLTRFVVGQAAATAATLSSVGIELPIAVNLTARDLLDPVLPDDIAAILAEHRLPPESLQIEITEDAMVVDFDTSIMVLTRLREMGLRVAIDDFGTGYSSLQHLHRLPIDQLKIDRSFVERLSTEDSSAAIVRASVSLGRDLGLQTVAEGVEDAQALAIVTALGCDEVQGFHVSRPLATPDFMRWVREWDAGAFVAETRRMVQTPDRVVRPFTVPQPL